jgi:hypothetical protein
MPSSAIIVAPQFLEGLMPNVSHVPWQAFFQVDALSDRFSARGAQRNTASAAAIDIHYA